jgi:hypothetical protein
VRFQSADNADAETHDAYRGRGAGRRRWRIATLRSWLARGVGGGDAGKRVTVDRLNLRRLGGIEPEITIRPLAGFSQRASTSRPDPAG